MISWMFSRITQGRIQLQTAATRDCSIVTDAMESVAPLIREKGHRVSVSFSSQPLYVDGDSARLVQCVTNLLTNAAKYTDHAGDIRLATRAEGPHAVISVSDKRCWNSCRPDASNIRPVRAKQAIPRSI